MTRIIEESELERLLAEAREPKWQPIETAPKDGVVILGFDPSWYDIAVPMVWDKKLHCWRFFQIDSEFRPPHWMPMPEAPKEIEK